MLNTLVQVAFGGTLAAWGRVSQGVAALCAGAPVVLSLADTGAGLWFARRYRA